jgi:hypothetical protein
MPGVALARAYRFASGPMSSVSISPFTRASTWALMEITR